MSSPHPPTNPSSITLFLLGATGYLGSQFLICLARAYPRTEVAVVALVRGATPERERGLKELYRNLRVVEGTLGDVDIVKVEAERAGWVVNVASADNIECVEAILAGLEVYAAAVANKPGIGPPVYIHISGLGMTSDNCRGKFVEMDKVRAYNDVGFRLDMCPEGNTHVPCNARIVQAGSKGRIRTMILFPAWVYGVGEGMQKITVVIRLFFQLFKQCGFAGTWGPGLNRMGTVHVKDTAEAMLTVFRAAVEGTADEGEEGLYFVVSDEPVINMKTVADKMGDILHEKGLLSQGSSKPMPEDVLDQLGFLGWFIFGGNQNVTAKRLKKFGWEPTETKKLSLMDSLPAEMEIAMKDW
ncbi:hypothetical protein AMATHDRAFT_43342 [Amanita thiersii Skay4041]|uniref:NmrA-like domain-containing protein n=1 Tax=Amanita thiersii Skay4041 TaxID=703135 RepID=A0A2A9NGD2_9AGAR|nr:hypothetical protein AMATHDRAFT_43342 [Amanita thiersii Skay4041]